MKPEHAGRAAEIPFSCAGDNYGGSSNMGNTILLPSKGLCREKAAEVRQKRLSLNIQIIVTFSGNGS
ncbi:hypothetical protein CXU21_11200 [Akkermansia muciniphila]|nr:hypothetical protein CXU21_11200 [Akkermansia muciniphila]